MEKKCNHCSTEKKATLTIPYVAHQEDMARCERSNRRQVFVSIALLIALLVTNLAWIIYESQFETMIEQYDVAQEACDDGDNNSTINGGEITNGEADYPLQTYYTD